MPVSTGERWEIVRRRRGLENYGEAGMNLCFYILSGHERREARTCCGEKHWIGKAIAGKCGSRPHVSYLNAVRWALAADLVD